MNRREQLEANLCVPLEREILDIHRQIEGLRDQLREKNDVLKSAKEKILKIELKELKDDRLGLMARLLEYDYQETTYKQCVKFFESQPLNEWVRRSGGYQPAVNQYCMQLRLDLTSADKLPEIAAYVDEIMQVIKQHENGLRYLDVMEPSLSADGSFNLWMRQDKSWILQCTRYSRTRDVATFTNTMEMVHHIQQHYAFGEDD